MNIMNCFSEMSCVYHGNSTKGGMGQMWENVCSVVRTEVGYKTTDAAGAQFSRACVCVRMCPCTCEWGVATVLGMEVLCGWGPRLLTPTGLPWSDWFSCWPHMRIWANCITFPTKCSFLHLWTWRNNCPSLMGLLWEFSEQWINVCKNLVPALK